MKGSFDSHRKRNSYIKNTKRVLIFLGSGSTFCFGGPRGEEILTALRTDKKYRTKANIPIGQFLYDKLYGTYGKETNFETIIASVELILNYHMGQQNPNNNPIYKSIDSIFLSIDSSFLEQIENYNIYKIPDEHESIILQCFVNDHTTEVTLPQAIAKVYYYSKILNHFLSIITLQISKYSEGESIYNQKLKQFVNYLIFKNYKVNFFTTNYDNLIPKVLDEKNVFNGFDIEVADYEGQLFNAQRIVFDDTSIKHFNLHGSVYWHYEFLMSHLESKFIFNDKEYNLPFYNKTDFTNPGEETILLNIITGYNKTQRTLYPPFSLMLESFIKEIVRADILIVIGYSFSDNHVNKILSLSLGQRPLKTLLITKTDDNSPNSIDIQRFKYLLKKFDNLSNPIRSNNMISSPDKSQNVYINGFGEFLCNTSSWDII